MYERLVLYLLLLLSVTSCSESETPADIAEICFTAPALRTWTVNRIPQQPGTSIEPNSGINLDFIFSIDKLGSWSINLTNEDYIVVFADFDQLISPAEFDNLSESEWEDTLTRRGKYDFVFEPEGRQELTVFDQDTLKFVGDMAGEVIGGEVEITVKKTDFCNFLVLLVKAQLKEEGQLYNVEIELENPYLFP